MNALRVKKEADALVRIRSFPYHQAKGNYDRAVDAQKAANRVLAVSLAGLEQPVEVDGVIYRATDRESGFEVIRPVKGGAA